MVNLFIRLIGTNSEGKSFCKAWQYATCEDTNIQNDTIIAIEDITNFIDLVNLYLRYQPCTIHILNLDTGIELHWNWASIESRAIKSILKAIINQIDYWNNERLEHSIETEEYKIATKYYDHWMHMLYELKKYDDIKGDTKQ